MDNSSGGAQYLKTAPACRRCEERTCGSLLKCSRTVAVDHLDAMPSWRSLAGSPAPRLVARSPVVFRWTFGRSTQEDRHMVHQVDLCPQALVHRLVKGRH